MSVEDLRMALEEAQLNENRLLCVSIADSLMPRVSDEEKYGLLKRKLLYLEHLPEAATL